MELVCCNAALGIPDGPGALKGLRSLMALVTSCSVIGGQLSGSGYLKSAVSLRSVGGGGGKN